MQIPNSYGLNGASSSVNTARKTNGSNESNDRTANRDRSKFERVAKDPQPTSARANDNRKDDFGSITGAAKAQLASQDLVVMPKGVTRVNSDAISRYQQVEAADTSSLQNQDPGLYRVDVFV
ncbi:MAG: hypothetical protein ACI9PX_000737 [Reinekea sp.]|jgi:hypothetical protein